MKNFFEDTNKASAWSRYPFRHPLGYSITSKSTTKHDAVSPLGVTCQRGNQVWQSHWPTYHHFQWPAWWLTLPVVETRDSSFSFPQVKRNFDPGWILPRVFLILDSNGFSSVQFSCSVVSDSLWLHESQHARPPCPSPTPGVHSDSPPSSRWCHPAISSSLVPFSSCPQSLPSSESFPVSQLFAWGGQSTG